MLWFIISLFLMLSLPPLSAASKKGALAVDDVTDENFEDLLFEALGTLTSLTTRVNRVKAVISQSVSAIYPRNCWEAYQRGKNVSGIYTIRPDSGPPFSVWCDQVTDGGGWTVFQRRQDGSVNFQKNRIDYVRGFGEVTGEHWLGLEKIHRLTKWSDFSPELWIDLEDFENETRFASYRNFWMEGPTSYTLQVQQYSGTAGDSLTYHRTVGFSTPDWDIDNSRGNCAVSHQGSWWFNNCYYSNLNGVYYHGKTTAGKGILWIHWKGNAYSLKRTEMKIRPSRWSRLIN